MNQFDAIVHTLHTKQDVDQLSLQLADLLKALYRQNLTNSIVTSIAHNRESLVFSLLSNCQNNPILMQKTINDLILQLSRLPVVTIYVAYQMPGEHVTRLSTWCNTYLQQKVILNLIVDSTLIAGAKIAYNGAFKDYSIAKIINDKRLFA